MITKKYSHLAYLIIFLIKSKLKYRCDYHTSSQVQTQKKKNLNTILYIFRSSFECI